MSQNLTQPEEIDHALMEISGQGMKMDTLDSQIIRHLNKSEHELKRDESADPKQWLRSQMHNPN